MIRDRAAKIVSTLGPSSSTPEEINDLFNAGVDVFRLNFSHSTHAEHKKRYDIIRKIEAKSKRPIGIIADLQGPKIRVDKFYKSNVELVTGSKYILDSDRDNLGDINRVSISKPEIYPCLKAGAELLLDDGKVKLIIEENNGLSVNTKVLVGGLLSDHKVWSSSAGCL